MRRTQVPRAQRWSPVRHAWRSVWVHRRGQALAMVAMSALVTACATFVPVYDRAMQQALVDTVLAQASTEDRTVTVLSTSDELASDIQDPQDPRDLARLLPDDVAARLSPPVLGRSADVAPIIGEVPPSGPLLWRDGACEHVRLLSGACPSASGEILVSETDVDNFGLELGAVRRVGTEFEELGDVRLEVVGTYAPADEAWWQGTRTVGLSSIFLGPDPSATHDAWLTTEQTFVDAPLLRGETSQAGASLPVATAGIDGVLALGTRLREVTRDLPARGDDLQIRTGLEDLTDGVRAQVQQAHRTVPLLMAPMAVLSIFVLWLVLGSATAQRRGEVAVARLRGRRPSGAVGLLLLELLPALLLGVAPGAAAAFLGGLVVASLLPGTAPAEVAPGFAVAVLLAVAALVLTTLAAAARTAREPLHDVVRAGAVPSRRWALGTTEAVVLAAVGTGVLAFATDSLQGPLALAGPALLALLTGLLLAHLGVPTARAAGRRLLGAGRLVPGVVLLEMGRRRETGAVLAVITVATALGVFSVDALAIGERNRAGASEHEAGAPAVIEVDGGDLDGVRAALDEADPTGRRATPVLVAGETLAVDPAAFRDVAFFPRGAPTPEQWQALAAPDAEAVDLEGTRIALDVRPGRDLVAQDVFGSDVPVSIGLVVTRSTGAPRTIDLGQLPAAGERRTLTGRAPECATGCRWVAVALTTAQLIRVVGTLDLSDLRTDGRPVRWGTSADDWNTTTGATSLIRPSSGGDGVLRLDLDTGYDYDYPVEVTPAWVPSRLPALLTDEPDEPAGPVGPVVTGVDGTDRVVDDAGRLRLVPSMPPESALVDLDAATRGAGITPDSRLEVWLADPGLVADVEASLREHGIAVADVRRHDTVRQAYDDSVASWSLALGAAVAPAVLLLALLVLGVLALIGRRSRARDLAVLRLHGVDRSTTRRLAVWAQLPPVLLAIAGGVAAGLAGAVLAMPDVALFAVAPEVPVVDRATSWPAVLAVAATCLVLLPAAAALAGLGVARRAHLERVRETL